MKKILFILCIMTAALSFGANPDGRTIAETVKDANKTKNRIVWSQMTVLDEGRKIETRKLILKSYRENEKDRVLFRFMNGLKRNVTFLSIDKEEDESIQYVYIPGVGRPRQISSSEKQNDFQDTDLTYADLGGRKIDDYRYRRLKDEAIKIGKETFNCYAVIAMHKDRDARFPKTKFWVDQKTWIPIRIQKYGRDRRLKREGVSALIREIKPGIFMPYYIYAKDVEKNHETKMVVQKVLVDTPRLNQNLFTPANMDQPWPEQ